MVVSYSVVSRIDILKKEKGKKGKCKLQKLKSKKDKIKEKSRKSENPNYIKNVILRNNKAESKKESKKKNHPSTPITITYRIFGTNVSGAVNRDRET